MCKDPGLLCLCLPAMSSWPYSSFPWLGMVSWFQGKERFSLLFFKTLPERVQKAGQSRLATFLVTIQPYQCIPSQRTACSAVSASSMPTSTAHCYGDTRVCSELPDVGIVRASLS